MTMSMLEKDLQEIDLDEVEEALDDADDDVTAEEDAFEKARNLLKESQQALQELSVDTGLGNILFQLANVAFADGFNLDEAEKLWAGALAFYEKEENEIR